MRTIFSFLILKLCAVAHSKMEAYLGEASHALAPRAKMVSVLGIRALIISDMFSIHSTA